VTRDGDCALLFPGQGSPLDGMASVVEGLRPDLLSMLEPRTFERASESTRYAQPAIFCASLALLPSALASCGRVGWMAGHSLGEFAALVAAGSLSDVDALRLVMLRGRLMDASAGGSGSMLALRGADDVREAAVEIAFETGTFVANENSLTQVVLAGHSGAVDEARRIARSRGLRASVLPVRGAFHTPLMESAVEPFAVALAQVEVRPPSVPVLSGVTGSPFIDIRGELAAALTAPVRWTSVLRSLHGLGARRFVEVGPGSVLTGLVRKTLDDVEAVAAVEGEPARA